MRPRVSVIIPTYNRRDLVLNAIGSVLAQTLPVDEIIVVDDGSGDGTADALQRHFGSRVLYVRQDNAGVAAARNHGLAIARGDYLALLDSDDEWLPEKNSRQVQWLDAHPDFGMVLCDVIRVTKGGEIVDVFRRREFIPEDGLVLRWVLRNPALAPVSAMIRRGVLADIGGFNTGLRTAEDIEFHLRVARRWPIGVVSESLVRAMRGHDGLSALASTYDDYQGVVERFVAECRGDVPDEDLDAGLAWACVRNARGMLLQGRWMDARRLTLRALRHAPDWAVRREALLLLPLALRRGMARARGKVQPRRV
ncbi:MAG: glycosyltransferase family 2 protein [Betaproteobacteria bacterium]|nr:glycosyltransferase family 2 protein [Betaproteobacteria bacterium]